VVTERSRSAFCCDGVSVMLVHDGKPTVAATTDPDVERAELLQVERGEGPGFEAATQKRDVVAEDLREEARWRLWGPKAAELRWRSVLSVSLVCQGRAFGALSLYSRRGSFFSGAELSVAELFSAQASVALAGARERDTLLRAVDARHLIGQAQGILMERYSMDAEQAFTVLRRYSSHLNRKLRQVAEDIVHDRQLPLL